MSQFKDLIEARKKARVEGSSEDDPIQAAVEAQNRGNGAEAEQELAVKEEAEDAAPAQTTSAPDAMATTTGKRSDPHYKQVNFYIRRENHHQTKLALLHDAQRVGEKPKDMSDLVDELLDGWLRARRNGESGQEPPQT